MCICLKAPRQHSVASPFGVGWEWLEKGLFFSLFGVELNSSDFPRHRRGRGRLLRFLAFRIVYVVVATLILTTGRKTKSAVCTEREMFTLSGCLGVTCRVPLEELLH